MPTNYTSRDFFLEDFERTLFPMDLNRLLVDSFTAELTEFIYQKCLNPTEDAVSFLPQQRVYATKQKGHLRRTVKLDPVADYYLYDVVYRNRRRFRKPHQSSRTHFGYRFSAGAPIPGPDAYAEFKQAQQQLLGEYGYVAKFDIASYFNSLYHHDIVRWLERLGADTDDVTGLGQALREFNSGRSIDCLPQGIYPAKMIGNDFVRFVEDSARLRSARALRFMDDFVLFDSDLNTLRRDFHLAQTLIGEKGLSLNPAKTKICASGDDDSIAVQGEQAIRSELSAMRRAVVVSYDLDPEEAADLSEAQRDYLRSLLDQPSIAEEDAELVLALMGEHSDDISEHLPSLLTDFPNLAKRIYYFCRSMPDKTQLVSMLREAVTAEVPPTEFQLFWWAKLAQDHLLDADGVGDLLMQLYECESATVISQSKILEIADDRFGMPDLREEHLRTGKSDWRAWTAAIGFRNQPAAQRNHLLAYFAKGSPINHLLYTCITTM